MSTVGGLCIANPHTYWRSIFKARHLISKWISKNLASGSKMSFRTSLQDTGTYVSKPMHKAMAYCQDKVPMDSMDTYSIVCQGNNIKHWKFYDASHKKLRDLSILSQTSRRFSGFWAFLTIIIRNRKRLLVWVKLSVFLYEARAQFKQMQINNDRLKLV